jgi:hypothetical protein
MSFLKDASIGKLEFLGVVQEFLRNSSSTVVCYTRNFSKGGL